MEDLKNVLIFTGSDLKEFITNIFINLVYFSIFLMITVILFFISIRYGKVNFIFFSGLFIIFILDSLLRKFFFIKIQLNRNFNYVKFMHKDNNELPKMPSSNEWKKITTALKNNIKNKGICFLPLNTLISLSVLNAHKNDKTVYETEFIKKINSISIKLLIKGYLLYFIILAPFILISFFFSIGMDIQIKILIFATAFIFANFVKISVINPILSLLLQRETIKSI